jgi:hypothetical protein
MVTMTLKLDEFWTAMYLGEWPETTTLSSIIPGVLESKITTSLPGLTLTLALNSEKAGCAATVSKRITPKLTARQRSEIIDDKRLKRSNRKSAHVSNQPVREIEIKKAYAPSAWCSFLGNETQRNSRRAASLGMFAPRKG